MPCCFVGARPDIEKINAALLAPKAAVRAVSKSTGVSRPALTRHLTQCLGGVVQRLPGNGALGDASPGATPLASGSATRATSRAIPEGQTAPAVNSDGATPGAISPWYVAALCSVRWGHPKTATTEERKIAFLYDLIETGRFYFRRTLDGLAEQWNESGAEVRRLFLLARSKLSADRQSLTVQLEITLNALEAREREALSEWRRLRKAQPNVAKGYLALARQLRGDIAEFVGLRKIRLEAELNVWTRPEFVAAVDSVTEAHVSVLLPASEQDEQSGLTVVYGKTEEAMGEKLTDRDRRLIGEALAQAAMLVDERIVQIIATGQGKQAGTGEPLAAE